MSEKDEQDNVVSLCKHRALSEQVDFIDCYEVTTEDAQAFLKVLHLLQSLSISETCSISVDGEFINFEVKHTLESTEVEDSGVTQQDTIIKSAEVYIPWSSIGKEDLIDDDMEIGEILHEGAEDLIDALCCLIIPDASDDS